MNLLIKEEEVLISDGKNVILTNHRIHKSVKDWGMNYSISVFLEDVTSVELRAQSIPLLLILGGLLFLLGLIMVPQARSNSQEAFFLIVCGLVLVICWFATKQRIIKISNSGGKSIAIEVRRMSQERSQEFVDKLLQAKASRVERLFKN